MITPLHGGLPLLVTIRPLHEEDGVRCHGRFCVYGAGRRLCISDTPLRDVGRGFLNVGVQPDAVLVVRHDLDLWDVVMTTIGAAAEGAAFEGKNIITPNFDRRTQQPTDRGAA